MRTLPDLAPLPGAAPLRPLRAFRAHVAALVCAPALVAGLAGCGAEAGPAADVRLESGRATRFVLRPDQADSVHAHLVVPSGAVAVEWRVRGAQAELECGVQPLERPGSALDAAMNAPTELGLATLRVDRWTEPPVMEGVWHAAWSWPGWGRPRGADGALDSLDFEVEPLVLLPMPHVPLEFDRPLDGIVAAEHGGSWRGLLEVPAGCPVLRLDLLEAQGDVDLLAYPGRELRALDDGVRMRSRPYGRETLLVEAPEPGPWTVEVVDAPGAGLDTTFRLLAGRERGVPAAARSAPRHPMLAVEQPGGAALGRALSSVVEVCTPDGTGSAVALHARGLYLTNAHVVAKMGGGVADEIVLCVTQDLREAPREMYRARVVELDEETDLALLELAGDLHGEPLPQGWTVPHLELGDGALPPPGAELLVLGHPGVGTQRTRPTLTVTRGIVSGYERLGGGWTIKSDAEITSGHSGGAAVDAQGRFVGTPTSRVEDGASQLGWINAASLVPERFRKRLAAR